MERKTVLDRSVLNKALDYEFDIASNPDRQLIEDLMTLISGDANSGLTIDQAIAAALRVAAKRPYVCAAGLESKT